MKNYEPNVNVVLRNENNEKKTTSAVKLDSSINEEKKMILDIYQKYKGNIDEKAITLLLKYLEINKKDLGEKERETHKK